MATKLKLDVDFFIQTAPKIYKNCTKNFIVPKFTFRIFLLFSVENYRTRSIVRIPNNVVTPFNAQATLHFYPAFWALYLPISVSGRVSDIWRSYVGQAFFKHLGLSLGFLPRYSNWF